MSPVFVPFCHSFSCSSLVSVPVSVPRVHVCPGRRRNLLFVPCPPLSIFSFSMAR